MAKLNDKNINNEKLIKKYEQEECNNIQALDNYKFRMEEKDIE